MYSQSRSIQTQWRQQQLWCYCKNARITTWTKTRNRSSNRNQSVATVGNCSRRSPPPMANWLIPLINNWSCYWIQYSKQMNEVDYWPYLMAVVGKTFFKNYVALAIMFTTMIINTMDILIKLNWTCNRNENYL